MALKDIKKEPQHTVLLHCIKCSKFTEVYIDSDQNVQPFQCTECWSREPFKEYDERAMDLTEQRPAIASSRSMQSFAIIWTPTGLQAVPVILPGFSSLVR